MGNSVTAAQLTLDQLAKVRILVPQLDGSPYKIRASGVSLSKILGRGMRPGLGRGLGIREKEPENRQLRGSYELAVLATAGGVGQIVSVVASRRWAHHGGEHRMVVRWSWSDNGGAHRAGAGQPAANLKIGPRMPLKLPGGGQIDPEHQSARSDRTGGAVFVAYGGVLAFRMMPPMFCSFCC